MNTALNSPRRLGTFTQTDWLPTVRGVFSRGMKAVKGPPLLSSDEQPLSVEHNHKLRRSLVFQKFGSNAIRFISFVLNSIIPSFIHRIYICGTGIFHAVAFTPTRGRQKSLAGGLMK